jgi:acyl-coenzyme A thioesterase PaaI-like protein
VWAGRAPAWDAACRRTPGYLYNLFVQRIQQLGSRLMQGPELLGDHPQAQELFAAWQAGGFAAGTALPFHLPGCFGCGPDNPGGIGLTAVAAEGDAVEATYTFEPRLQGAPGVAHGGAVAAVLDDLFGFLIVRLLVPAVTRQLTVDYQRAVHLEVPSVLRAELAGRDGRELSLRAELRQQDHLRAAATATFVELAPERLLNRYERIDRPGEEVV